jgi:sporulation protein YlmC with PRC-barrel domain
MRTDQSFLTAAAGHIDGSRRLVASNNAKGTPVYAADGNRLGRIERVMVDQATGDIAYAIVNFGRGDGIGFEIDQYPVPWSLLAYNPRFEGYELKITNRQASRHM